ncbi:uncharacterized protein FOMMEDRAFT_23604 [Fomitiporia mediterranea MF3/22]|uniref:uncharacterized protein n=1 Tax=Fomitiporia mediterranea (strain MF3/22) TaxID=694068 RepID=UPI0004407DC7|nr:uncharacterized protein FOMMEDRAFT_23604 [Fomitiporia mediterranea MF3/22]EJC98818.1 hypothetical protein FOMMEDRAFT_23604 [Fomitiporia mediterranea MF3/22]
MACGYCAAGVVRTCRCHVVNSKTARDLFLATSSTCLNFLIGFEDNQFHPVIDYQMCFCFSHALRVQQGENY